MVLVYSQCCVVTTINFSTLLSPKEQTVCFPIPAFSLSSLRLPAAPHLLSVSVCFPILNTTCVWSHIMCVLLCLSSFIWSALLKVHLCHSMC